MHIRLTLLILLVTLTTINAQIQCENDSLGLVPLVDLKTGYYLGAYQGGLYPNGKNKVPNGHIKKGLKISKSIKPLDTLGNVNYETGKIVFAGFGGSTTGEPFNHLITIANADPTLNPCLKLLNATNAGEGLDKMNLDHPEYWDYIENNRLATKGYTREQIQIAWLFNGSRSDTIFDMPAYRDTIDNKLRRALIAMLAEYPNLKIVYLSSPYYAGYADPTYELFTSIHEPGSYRSGFGYKQAIEKQITGDINYRYSEPGKVMPFILWGPYVWADGNNPRNYDSLYWDCEADFRFDGGGFHLNGEGKDKFAYILHDFFAADTLSEIWYNDGPKWVACGDGRYADGNIYSAPLIGGNDLVLYPTLNTGIFTLSLPETTSGYAISIIDNMGRVVYSERINNISQKNMNLHDLPNGLYYCAINSETEHQVESFIIQK